MTSKFPPFFFSKRIPNLVSQTIRFYSIPCLAHVQSHPENDQNPPNFSSLDAALRSLKNKPHPEKLIRVIDSTSDPISAVEVFRWASRQKNFWQTAETYAHLILKLGLAGNCEQMDDFLKEMVKFRYPDMELAFSFLIESFCRNFRPREALKVFEIGSSAKIWLPISTCNAVLSVLAQERSNFDSLIFVYKEMVKAGVVPNVATLNYLIKVLIETARLGLALDQFNRMEKKKCSPNSWTFEMVISGLCSGGRVHDSVKILNQMLDIGCSRHRGFYTTIIPLLCEVHRLEESIKLFKLMKDDGFSPELDLYGVLIQCLCEVLRMDDAVDVFEEMGQLGFAPSTSMYVNIVNGYCQLEEFGEAVSFLEENNASEIEPYNALLKGFCDLGSFSEAASYLEKMEGKGLSNCLSWNILIRGLCESGDVGKGFQVLCRMIVSSYLPDEETHSSIVTGYCKIGSFESGFDWSRQDFVKSMCLDSDSYSNLIEGLCRINKSQDAVEVFYWITRKGCALNTDSLNVLIEGLCQKGKVDEAIKLRSLAFSNGTLSTPLAYERIMLGLLDFNKESAILPLLSQMLVEGCALGSTTYRILIRGLCDDSTCRTATAALLFNQMVHSGFTPDSGTLEKVVFGTSKCSLLHMVALSLDKVFEEEGLLSPTIFNMVIYGLLKEGHKKEASKFLDQMIEKGWVPDANTHGLLVGNVNVEERGQSIEAYEDGDGVSNILAEGFENSH